MNKSKILNKSSNASIYYESSKEMSNKRNISRESCVKKRENNAKKLMNDILNENYNLILMLSKSELDDFETFQRSRKNLKDRKMKSARSTSAKSCRFLESTFCDEVTNKFQKDERFKTSSPVPFRIIPPLIFKQNQAQINVNEAEINLESKKPSLMAKTTLHLYKAELEKRNKQRELIKQFQLRAQTDNLLTSKQVKIIKPYSDVVCLGQQYKLRDRIDGKSMTYCQRLKLLQEKSSIIFKCSTKNSQLKIVDPNQIKQEMACDKYIKEDFVNRLLNDAFENQKLTENALNELEMIEKNRNKILSEIDDGYVNQLMINGLLNFSLRSDATISSYIDWDQIDQLLLIKG